jgi:hypothetical protein
LKKVKDDMPTAFCNKCNTLVTHQPDKTIGCRCDPDAPTWIAYKPDGKLMAFSHANYSETTD